MKILKTAKKAELFCAYVLEDCILQDGEYIVGDIEKDKLPDIYSEDKKHGIEVVQAERENDFKLDDVCRYCENNEYNYAKVNPWCEKKYPEKYYMSETNGKINMITGKEGAHKIDWMKDIYENEIRQKLIKLNKGNYSGITGKVDLCISIVHRLKDEYDAKLILFVYISIVRKFSKFFDKIYVITSSSIFILNPNNIKNIQPICESNCITNFDVTGDGYIKEIKYNYGDIVDRVVKYCEI